MGFRGASYGLQMQLFVKRLPFWFQSSSFESVTGCSTIADGLTTGDMRTAWPWILISPGPSNHLSSCLLLGCHVLPCFRHAGPKPCACTPLPCAFDVRSSGYCLHPEAQRSTKLMRFTLDMPQSANRKRPRRYNKPWPGARWAFCVFLGCVMFEIKCNTRIAHFKW